MNTIEQLDSEELFRLALLDVQASRHDQAIVKLKQVISREPEDARAHFMLAAEHAELGLYERAEEGMRRALAIDPQLHTARFQLGLLQYSRGLLAEARLSWQELESLGSNDPLNLFQAALMNIQAGELGRAAEELENAQKASISNPALGNDIAKVLANVRNRLAETGEQPAAATRSAGLLHRYGDSLDQQ